MSANATLRFFAAIAFLFLLFASAHLTLAQTPGNSRNFPGADLDNRQLTMDHSGDANRKLSPRDTKIVLANINEDFQRYSDCEQTISAG